MSFKITQRLQYIVDVLMAVSFLTCSITGVVKFPGLLHSIHINPRRLPMDLFTIVHDWSGIVICLLVLVHLILHWKWIVHMTKTTFEKKKPSLFPQTTFIVDNPSPVTEKQVMISEQHSKKSTIME
jgi:hypothetical protein